MDLHSESRVLFSRQDKLAGLGFVLIDQRWYCMCVGGAVVDVLCQGCGASGKRGGKDVPEQSEQTHDDHLWTSVELVEWAVGADCVPVEMFGGWQRCFDAGICAQRKCE
jgi:hypothetical protein